MLAPGGFSDPRHILTNLHIPEGSRVSDFGSGSGYFTLLLAQTVGTAGKVTAVDIQAAPLQVVRTRAQDRGLFNIDYVRGNLEIPGASTLPDSSQDMVLLANILFQSRQKTAIAREATRVLRSGGELVMIDWIPETPYGPKELGWKLSKEEGKVLGESVGLAFVREFPASINHWGLLFKKP
jgi:ubiquinone/menaquinone biosynthesis C-methylase UbiE